MSPKTQIARRAAKYRRERRARLELSRHQSPIEADRKAVAERGLAEFVRRAWHEVDPAPLKWNWHHDLICERLERLTRGEIRKLIIMVPPGTTKTLIASVLWPAWDWIENADRKYITVSYGPDVILESARQQRDLVASDWYQARWPGVGIPRQNTHAASFFKNSMGGFRFSTSTGGPMTGRHGHVHLGDDLNKAQDALGAAGFTLVALDAAWRTWSQVMPTRQVSPTETVQCYIGQRLHDRDVPGRWLEAEGDEIEVLCLPMRYAPDHPYVCEDDPRTEPGELLWPEHIPEQAVQALEKTLGVVDAAAQLGQLPSPLGGAVFRREWVHLYRRLPKGPMRWCQSWDMTFKQSGTSRVCGTVWANRLEDDYLVDRVHARLSFPDTIDALIDLTLAHPESGLECIVEPKANGPAVVDELKRSYLERCAKRGVSNPPPLHFVEPEPTGSKLARANATTGRWSSGHVWLPEDAPWVAEYLHELLRFTGRGAEASDQVDSTTQALRHLHGGGGDWVNAMIRYRQKQLEVA